MHGGDVLLMRTIKDSDERRSEILDAAESLMTENQQKKLKQEMKQAAARFYKSLVRRTQYPAPSLFRLMLFRMTRTSLKHFEALQLRDYYYYQEKGWFESDYYYDTSLGPLKKTAGRFFDFLGRQIAKQM